MIHAKKYAKLSKSVKVRSKYCQSFFPDTVYKLCQLASSRAR